MSKNLSQIVADLFAKSTGGEDRSSKIQRLRSEIKNEIESGDTVFGKLRGLLESFREIIPDEKQRYLAAFKALSTTSKLSQHEIVKAVDSQLEELKVLEKSLVSAIPGWHDELKAMEARSGELKGEIAKLRERIVQLESEETTILTGMSAQEKELELVQKTIKDMFADIEAEITFIKKKVEVMTSEAPAVQPSPKNESQKNDVPGKKSGSEGKTESQSSPPPEDAKFQRKCPMCGGHLNLLEFERKWQCYACAYEEAVK